MNPGRTRRSTSRRTWIAVAAALTVHAVLLGVMGLVRPQFEARGFDDRQAVELQILPPLGSGLRTLGAAPRLARLADPTLAPPTSPLAGLGAPATLVTAPPSPASAAAQAQIQTQAQAAAGARAASNTYPGFFNGEEPGCGTEDVALLTADEKVRCRNQIEVARARRAAAAADADRAARMAAMRLLPKVDGLPPEKRAAYDAVAAAQAAVRDDVSGKGLPNRDRGLASTAGNFRSHVDMNASVHCTMAFGAGVRPVVHCPHSLPTGFLTEEARTSPP